MEEERNENPNISRGDKLNMSKISRQIQETGRRCIWMHEESREGNSRALLWGSNQKREVGRETSPFSWRAAELLRAKWVGRERED